MFYKVLKIVGLSFLCWLIVITIAFISFLITGASTDFMSFINNSTITDFTIIILVFAAIGCGVALFDRGGPSIIEMIEEGNIHGISRKVNSESDYEKKKWLLGYILVKSALYGKLEIMKTVLRKGADINTLIPNEGTALMVASWVGNTEIVRELIKLNADLNLSDGNSTALDNAIENNHLDIAEILKGVGGKRFGSQNIS